MAVVESSAVGGARLLVEGMCPVVSVFGSRDIGLMPPDYLSSRPLRLFFAIFAVKRFSLRSPHILSATLRLKAFSRDSVAEIRN